MTPTLWIGIVIIICMLEFVRIGMTTYVLLHLLQSPALRRPGDTSQSAVRSLRTSAQRARREALLDPTLRSLRAAMEDVQRGVAGKSIDTAVEYLDRYAQALVEERAQS